MKYTYSERGGIGHEIGRCEYCCSENLSIFLEKFSRLEILCTVQVDLRLIETNGFQGTWAEVFPESSNKFPTIEKGKEEKISLKYFVSSLR